MVRNWTHIGVMNTINQSINQSIPTACDGVVQHGRDMQQNSCRVELNGFSVELDGRGLKRCARVRSIIYEVPKSPGSWGQGGYIDIWQIHELRDVDI